MNSNAEVSEGRVDYGLLVFFVLPLVFIFLGPLAAIAGLVAYWFVQDNTDQAPPSDPST